MTSLPIIARFSRLGHGHRPAAASLPGRNDLQFQPPMNHWLAHDGQLPDFVRSCPVALRYLHLLGPLAWDRLPERRKHANGNPHPLPYAPLAAACLIKLDQQLPSMAALRQYLVEHPALAWLCGFPVVTAQRPPTSADVAAALPTQRHFTRLLRQTPNAVCQVLLDSSVALLQAELTVCHLPLEVVSLDTKHVIAWVKENNPKVYVADRYDKTKQPQGDPDCKLGCKKRRNKTDATTPGQPAPAQEQSQASTSTPTTQGHPASHTQIGEFYWGYASGIVAVKVPGWGEFVLAEITQTFDRGDTICFFPLMQQVERRLGGRPKYGALDAAFDAHYVYDYFDQAGGFAAVPLAQRGKTDRTFDAAGLPICPAGLAMPLKDKFWCRSTAVEHERGHYACPLQYPQRSAETCPVADEHWPKGGCLVTMPTSPGARIRLQLDRTAEQYKAIYAQRTATERIFSQALDLGIERPKLRNGAAVANANSLIYVLLNLRTLQRLRQRRSNLATPESPASPV